MPSLAIVGSRLFTDYEKFKTEVIRIIESLNIEINRIVSGGALGTDTMAKQFAIENNLEIIEFLPDWKKFGRAAGPIRNTDIIKNSDIIIAFYHEGSKGTLDSIKEAQKMNKELHIINI